MIKKHLLLLLLITLSSNSIAQSKKELKEQAELKSQIWGDGDAYKNAIDVPEKWANESGVYLVKSIQYIYDRPHNSIEYTKIERNRIKLLDQAAVNDFSEFKYQDDNVFVRNTSLVTNSFILELKVIKPDGTEIEIDASKETITTNQEKKIAIPSLEKGDIIDYYLYANTIVGENDLFQYKPVEDVIGDTYPIATYDFKLEAEDDFFVSFNSYNGAPVLEQLVKPTKENDKKRVYGFKVNDVILNDFPRWYYPLVALPSYKFQILFARSGKYENRAYAFISDDCNIIKSNVSKEEIFNLYEDKFRPDGKLKDVRRFLKDKNYATNEEKVKQVFYYIRHAYYTNYIESVVLDESNIMYPYGYHGKNPIIFNKDEEFVKFFTAFLKDAKIDYEILIGTKRFNGDIRDLLLESNVDFILKVNTENPIYIEDFNSFSTVNQISPQLEGTSAYSLKVENRKYITDVNEVKIPKSTYLENNSLEKLELTITPDFSQISVQRNSKYTGQNKVFEQDTHLNFYDYVSEDHAKFGTTPILDRVKRKKNREKYKKEYAALLQTLKDKQLKQSESRASQEFDVSVEDYSIEILNNGRFGKTDPLEYTEEFTISNELIKKAGKNYIMDIGRFLGGQIDLSEKEKMRSNNIYMSHARSLDYEIVLNIPEGYTVSGVEKLSKNVDNLTGGFSTKATIDGDKLFIKINKHYKNYYEPSSSWPQMVEFLDAAYQFTQSKILLKKKA
jgi:hypothetical protein